jgi:glycosyltransferase involved in cell wall biosynthesis
VRVGLFSPLPPARTGVADYAQALREALSPFCEVLQGAADADVCLYHLGNNQLHAEAYAAALARPGVAVLHDAVLDHFFLGRLGRADYVEEFVFNYGEWSRELAGRLWDGRAHSGHDPVYFERAMVRRAAENSLAVVVHNPGAAGIVRTHAPRTRVVEIPHLYQAGRRPEAPDGAARWRADHGIAPSTYLFGVFGYLREPKRLACVVRAFEMLGEAEAALLVAGEFTSPDHERAMEPLLAGRRIVRTGYLPEPEFRLAASAVDACLNLRYPWAGETSGVTIRLMGLGKPVVVTAGEEIARLPASAVIAVDSGVAEIPMLAEYLKWLLRNPERGREIGRCASAYIASRHGLDQVAGQYLDLLRSCC